MDQIVNTMEDLLEVLLDIIVVKACGTSDRIVTVDDLPLDE